MMFSKILKAICKPKLIALYILNFKMFRLLPDDIFLRIKYRLIMGKPLDLKKPKTFNEKLQWLKLYDRKPEYTKLVDKYEVRKYIAETIGEQYLIPLLGVYDSFDDIDFDTLPNQFVLKPNHTSGNVFICKDKLKIDFNKLRKKVNKWLKREYYWLHREWPYKNVKPRIICEKFLEDNITDYKFMCFHGEPKLIQIHRNRGRKDQTLDFYDVNWNKTEIRRDKPTSQEFIPKPKNLDEMLSIARILSKDEIHVRIDLYEVEGKVYFSEKTFFSASGFSKFAKEEYDELIGRWIKLPIN